MIPIKYSPEDLKSDIRMIVKDNPQPLNFIVHFAKNTRADEVYTTKADFGLRLLELIENNRTLNIYISEYKQRRYFNRMASPIVTSIVTKEKTGSEKNLEYIKITVENKLDARKSAAYKALTDSDPRFDSKYQGD